MTQNDDMLMFASEEEEAIEKSNQPVWKILVVDDDELVHNTTKLVLTDFKFEEKKVILYHAFSSSDAKKILKEHKDIAVIFLDVVMETEDSGLKMVKYIREDLKNSIVRIILRTGQPGQAPEEKVIVEYDINDYKTKTELTVQKLYTSLISALRSYRDLMKIERNRKGLKHIIDSTSTLFEITSLKRFTYGLLTQLSALFEFDEQVYFHRTSGLAAIDAEGSLTIIAANGEFSNYVDQDAEAVLPFRILSLMKQASKEGKSLIGDNYFVGYYKSMGIAENFIIFDPICIKDEVDKELLELFSSNISVAFDNIYMNKRIVETQKEIIMRIGEVAENRFNGTNHVKRVSEYAYMLAKFNEMTDDMCNNIRMTAPMHDIGKIGVDDKILSKPSTLTTSEFDEVKQHTVLGKRILGDSEFELIKQASKIALTHHENWDGNGYPDGLRGEEIPIEGRIVALADVLDALGQQKPYKGAWSDEEIVEFVRSERGKKFDPKLVDLFLKNMNVFLEVKNDPKYD